MRLGEEELLISILYKLSNHHAMRCEYASSREVGAELDALARSDGEDFQRFHSCPFRRSGSPVFHGKFCERRVTLGSQLLQSL